MAYRLRTLVRPAAVDHHAAAAVVGGGHHRDGLRCACRCPAPGSARWMLGKRSARKSGVQVGHVQQHVVVAGALHLGVDGPGHDVARGEVLQLVVAGHEGRAVAQPQDAALAAQRLADQEGLGLRVVKAGRVELEELHVRHRAPPPGRPWPRRRRWPRRGWRCRGTPCPRRRWPAPPPGRRWSSPRRSSGRRRRPRTPRWGRRIWRWSADRSPGDRRSSVMRSPRSAGLRPAARVWMAAPVMSRACTMRRALWPPSRPRAKLPVGVAIEVHPQLVGQVQDVLGRLAHAALDHLAACTGRRPPPACPRCAARGSRRAPARRPRRPGRTGCWPRWATAWSPPRPGRARRRAGRSTGPPGPSRGPGSRSRSPAHYNTRCEMHPPARALGLPVASARAAWAGDGGGAAGVPGHPAPGPVGVGQRPHHAGGRAGRGGAPAGYPLHTWLGFLLARLPGVPPPMAVGWVSAIPGALLCVPVASLAWQLTPVEASGPRPARPPRRTGCPGTRRRWPWRR